MKLRTCTTVCTCLCVAKKRARKNSNAAVAAMTSGALPMTAPLPQTLKDDVTSSAQADLAAILEQVMLNVKSLPRLALTEPQVAINFGGLRDGQLLNPTTSFSTSIQSVFFQLSLI